MMKDNKMNWMFYLFLATGLLFSELRFLKKDKYLNGPQKEWSQRQFAKYYRYINKHSRKTADSDEQILRRQDAIISGNKITTQIWNYGSISEPGNRVTDIIWEGLGYGYEFGPFISAEVPLMNNNHPDA